MSGDRDLLIVGGGICGLSLAVHAARRGLQTTLVEARGLGGVSTERSGALLRAHYADRSSAWLAKRGLAHFADFAERYGGSAGFDRTGFAYVPEATEIGSGEFDDRIEMLHALGVEIETVDAEELRMLDPSLDVSDTDRVAFEPNSGYADPQLTTAALARAASEAGADLRPHSPVAELLSEEGGGRTTGVVLNGGETIAAAATVLCAGAWSAELARPLELDLPLRPTAVKLAFFERRVAFHLTVIDAPGGIYMRQLGADSTLVGRRTWTDEPLEDADTVLPELGDDFIADARTRLVNRMPSSAGARCTGGRAGMLDMTPDGLPLIGPSPIEGLWLCCGWSGTGFKTGPAVGELLAAWIVGEQMPTEISAFDPQRRQVPAGALRSPH